MSSDTNFPVNQGNIFPCRPMHGFLNKGMVKKWFKYLYYRRVKITELGVGVGMQER